LIRDWNQEFWIVLNCAGQAIVTGFDDRRQPALALHSICVIERNQFSKRRQFDKGFVLSGQGAPIVPARYGQKYLHGRVKAPSCQVFITRGVGTISPPVRLLCRPEIVLITLI
jgi:hypothetical protein